MKIFTRCIQTILILIPIGLFGWLLTQELVVSGVFVIHHPVSEISPFVESLLPDQRVTRPQPNETGDMVQTITGDPVSFFVHPHRAFDTIEAKIWFRNSHTSIVEFGGLSAKDPDRYQLIPIQNTLIDSSTWNRLTDGNKILLQRNSRYKSLADFYAHPPAVTEVATYHATLENPFRLPGYVPSNKTQTLDVTLRGRMEMKMYVKNEPLDFLFQFMDMNRDEGADPISISVFDEAGNVVGGAQSIDDGNSSKNAFPSLMRSVHVTIANLPEGVYKLVFDANRDIFVRHITTSQQKLIFLNTLYFGDEVGYHETYPATQFWTEAKRISFQTRQASGIQTIPTGSQNIAVTEPYKLFTQTVKDAGLVNGWIRKGDMEVIVDSPIALSKDQYFRPDPVRLLPHTKLDQLGINYVLAEYVPPQTDNGWSVATVTFNANDLLLENNSWKFGFSLPEIQEQHGSVEVKQIDLRLERAPFTFQDLIKKILP